MSDPNSLDWATTRGEKWSAQLAGMEATLAPVDAPLLAALRLEVPCSIADVACGGGGTTLEILRRAPAGSIVHGYDISPALIGRARERVPAGVQHVGFEVADLATAVPKKPYQRLVSRFGVMFFHDPPAAFANLTRWLQPGGRFAFAVWGPPSDNPWMTTVREVVARAVEVPKPDPDAPGPFRYADVDRLLALLEGAGFAGAEWADWRGLLPIGGGIRSAAAADFALTAFSSFGELLAAAGDGALDEARRELTNSFSRYESDGAVRLDARVHLVSGTRR
ncbi:class I SAM-dependent methyltransferase [Vulgatibacter sp.]|uniref:class I SAM-dependent methyltransferase n=1 Tax=Vulgatibacter sp. TaxID=1971226 RepID=UPI003564D979